MAVAARGSSPTAVQRFVRDRYGAAPIRVYLDPTGSIAAAFRVSSHPQHRFVTARGRLTTHRPAGYPFG